MDFRKLIRVCVAVNLFCRILMVFASMYIGKSLPDNFVIEVCLMMLVINTSYPTVTNLKFTPERRGDVIKGY